MGQPSRRSARGLGLGEDHAGAAHRRRLLLHLERQFAHLVDGDLQQIGENLHAPAGPGGALVVHQKVRHLALFVDPDGLAVLAAHVQHGAHRRAVHKIGARAWQAISVMARCEKGTLTRP